MNKNEAIHEVKNLGRSYFYDDVVDITDEQILDRIQQDVQGTRLTAMHYWERSRDALQVILVECSEQELDDMLDAFGHVPEIGSRLFFSHLNRVITEAIEIRKQ